MSPKQTLFSTGSAAHLLGLTRDSLIYHLRSGAPEPTTRLAGRRVFTEQDVRNIAEYLRNKKPTNPKPNKIAELWDYLIGDP